MKKAALILIGLMCGSLNAAMTLTKQGSVASGTSGPIGIVDHYALTINGGGNDIVVVDLSNPTNPTIVKRLTMPAKPKFMHINGTRAYVALVVNSGPEFYVLDVSHPETLSNTNILGSMELPSDTSPYDGIDVEGNIAYVGHGLEVSVIDVTNPAAPVRLSGIAITQEVFGIEAVGTHLFVSRESHGEATLRSFDCSNPAACGSEVVISMGKLVRSYALETLGTTLAMGNYDGDNVSNISFLDVTNPATVRGLKSLTVGDRVYSITGANKFIFAGTDSSDFDEINVIDVSDNTNPATLATAKTGRAVYGIRVYQKSLIIGDSSGLTLYDISAFIDPDAVAPTVNLDPSPFSVLSGTVSLHATASDNFRVANVSFFMDGQPIGIPVKTVGVASDYTFYWNTSLASDGNHQITAVATDIHGNATTSSAVTMRVDNAGGDHINPEGAWRLPLESETVANRVLLELTLRDNFGVQHVQYYLDNTPLGPPLTAAPFRLTWNTKDRVDGVAQLTADVVDTSGNLTHVPARLVTVNNSRVWYKPPVTSREYYVAPDGTGNGFTKETPMSLLTATTTAKPGDLFWMLQGLYPRGDIVITNGGSDGNPVVFRAYPGHRAIMRSNIVVRANNVYLWGLEVTDPDDAAANTGIDVNSGNVQLINNIVMDGKYLGIWNGGPGQVVYGNLVFTSRESLYQQRSHLLYTQNHFRDHGYKYFIQNLFMNAPRLGCNKDATTGKTTNDCTAVHAYTENGFIQGFVMEENVVTGGRFIIGGFKEPSHSNVVKNNYFYKVTPEFGYRRPSQVEFTGNYVGRGTMSLNWWWGAGETVYEQRAPMVCSNNSFLNTGNTWMDIQTSAYTPGRQEGVVPFNATDEMDSNRYSDAFKWNLRVKSNVYSASSLAQWSDITQTHGLKKFDAASTLEPFPTENKVVILKNDYEAGRGVVVIYNWGLKDNIQVDLSQILPLGSQFKMVKALSPFETPVVSGVWQGAPVPVATNLQEFMVFVVTLAAPSSGDTVPPVNNGDGQGNTGQQSNLSFRFNPVMSAAAGSSEIEIPFSLGSPENVSFKIYDRNRALVRTLDEGTLEPGVYSLTWDGLNSDGVRVSSGVYMLKIQIGDSKFSRKLVVIR